MAIFIASLLGSMHCAAMCGGVVLAYSGLTSKPHRAHFAYHLGRLLSYVVIGALAGALGERVNLIAEPLGVRALAPMIMGTLLTVWGLFALLGPGRIKQFFGPRVYGVLGAPSRFLMQSGRQSVEWRALFLGLGTGLLPCGWLYGFVAVAVASSSMWWGAGSMAAFWLGSLPALTSVGLFAHLASAQVRAVIPRISAALVLLAGLAALSGHVFGMPFLHEGHSGRSQVLCTP